MTTFASLVEALSGATLDTLADFDRRAALGAGLNPDRVGEWERVHHTYFGPTKWVKQQRLAVAAARSSGLGVDQLVYIERRLAGVRDASRRWALRRELLAVRGDFRALKQRAKALIPATPPTPPKEQVTFSKSKSGRRTMTVTADEREIADLEHALSRGLDAGAPAAPQMLGRFLSMLRGGGGAGVPAAAPRPLVLVPLPEWVSIMDGHGDDTVLGLSDGTTMTGAQFLAANLAEQLEVALFHPAEGAVNLYRTQRLANQKQRDLARAMRPSCPVPGCRHGADSCEIHHIEAWRFGGETNVSNLAPLCRYHNRVNDDDPRRGRRGRVERVRGAPVWRSPRGVVVPPAARGAMELLFE